MYIFESAITALIWSAIHNVTVIKTSAAKEASSNRHQDSKMQRPLSLNIYILQPVAIETINGKSTAPSLSNLARNLINMTGVPREQ